MTTQIELKAEIRKPKETKDHKFIPAVLYGSGAENTSLKVMRNEFEKVFSLAGESSLINLETDGGKPMKIIIKSIQRDPIKNFITHADFFHVSMDKAIETEVPLEFIGEAPAVKEQGGFLVKAADSLQIECLPGDLVNHIDIDISSLKEIGDSLRICDIKAPAGIKILNDENETVVSVEEPRKEETVAPTEAPAEDKPAVKEEGAEEKK